VAYAGQHLKTINFKNSKFTSEEGIVTQFDIDHLYNEAQNVELEKGYKVIQVIPKSFIIDNEISELNPVGITGRKIEANYKLVVLPETYLVNLKRVFDKLDVQMGEITLSSLAISEAVLSNDEKEMGVIVLDLGAGTTKMAIYHENRLMHTAVIPFGGDVVSQDIKEGCSILLKWATQLKMQYGQALGDFADEQKVVTIPGFNGWEPKEISFKSLAFIIQARLEEIIDSVYHQIEKSGIEENLGAGIVLAGGTSNIENIISLVKFRTGMDARKANLAIHGFQKNKDVQNPDYFTALGLLASILNKETTPYRVKTPKAKKEPGKRFTPWINNFVQGVLNLVDDENEDIPLN
jgi:cell division protein FtsA